MPDRGHRVRPDSFVDLSLDFRCCPCLGACFRFCFYSSVSLDPFEVRSICPVCPCLLLAPCTGYRFYLQSANREVVYLDPVCSF